MHEFDICVKLFIEYAIILKWGRIIRNLSEFLHRLSYVLQFFRWTIANVCDYNY